MPSRTKVRPAPRRRQARCAGTNRSKAGSHDLVQKIRWPFLLSFKAIALEIAVGADPPIKYGFILEPDGRQTMPDQTRSDRSRLHCWGGPMDLLKGWTCGPAGSVVHD